jgi:SET domain-containing protein
MMWDSLIIDVSDIKAIVSCINICSEERNHSVDVRPSTINNAGYGLFARNRIQPDDRIATYGGEMTRVSADKAPNGDYIYLFPEPLLCGHGLTEAQIVTTRWRGTYRDAHTHFRISEMGRWINHDATRVNAFADIDGKDADGGWVLSFYAARTIEAGEEIFIDYGPHYIL